MLERIPVRCRKKSRLSFTVRACPHVATALVEPYTTALDVHSPVEHTDVTIMGYYHTNLVDLPSYVAEGTS